MTTDNRHKWECISPGEYDTTYKCSSCGALFTDQADDPNSLIPEFGCTMTTDKVTGTFEDRPHKELGVTRTVKAFRETATNTDLSSKTVEELFDQLFWGVGNEPHKAQKELARRLEEAQQRNAAHDAKVAAEALEEIPAMIRDFCADQGWHEIARIPNLETLIRDKAAEYRAKATEAGRKE